MVFDAALIVLPECGWKLARWLKGTSGDVSKMQE
jgi:hypothetical protein